MAVTDAAETFWQRFLATYRFRRRFGRESWWASFRGAIRARSSRLLQLLRLIRPYDERNRAELVQLLVRVSGQKADDVEKAYDFFRKNNFFDRTGKISRAKLNALLDALVGLGDLPARGNIERFLLPGVAELSD